MSRDRSLALKIPICVLISSLLAGSAWAGIAGKIKKGAYISPAGNFSVPLPTGLGLRVSDGYYKREGIGAVSFHDDFGGQRGIHFMQIPADVTKALDDQATRRNALAGFLEQVALPTWFLHVSKETRILMQESMQLDNMDAVIGLVSIPGGATISIVDSEGSRPLDSTRGVLALYHEGFFYLLTTEVGGGAFSLHEEVPNRQKQLATTREILTKFYATIQFRAPR